MVGGREAGNRLTPTTEHTRAPYVGVLCLVTLVAGFLTLRDAPNDEATAIRVDSAAGSAPAPVPQTVDLFAAAPAPAGAISLPDLARELVARAATSTTRPKTTATTRRPAATATSTTRPPTPTTTTTPAPARQAPTTTTTAALTPLPTIVQAVVPPAVAVAGAVTKTDSGVASWFNAPDATCAHRTLPKGTMIKVTRTHNGASTSCRVNDWGPTLETGRLIDLSLDTFEKLAAKEAGLIDVNIEW